MMRHTHAALLALGTFALGIALGQGWNAHSTVSISSAQNVAATTALPPGHPAVGTRSLEDAVRATLRMNGVVGVTAAKATGSATAADDHAVLIAQADDLRRQRKFTAAADVYRRLIAAGAMTADLWADYADALASATSSLSGEPARALTQALSLDPSHAKALWLKASLEHEEHRYGAAVKTWQSLLAVVPEDSSDAQIIRANIDEATRLAIGRS